MCSVEIFVLGILRPFAMKRQQLLDGEEVSCKKSGRKPAVQDLEIVEAIKKLGVEIFGNNKSLKVEKDYCWHLIFVELKAKIQVHSLRVRIRNNLEFYYNAINSSGSSEIQNSRIKNNEKNISQDTNLDTVFDSKKAIRKLKTDCVFGSFVTEVLSSPFYVNCYWPEQLAF